jgi:hypothetical protein
MRIAVTFSFLMVSTLLFLTWKSSRRLSDHKSWANLSFWSTVVAILVTEGMVRLNGGVTLDPLLAIHLGFAGSFLALFLSLRFWITGLKKRRLHKVMGYTCFAVYTVTFATGMYQLWM